MAEFPFAGVDMSVDDGVVSELLHKIARKAIRFVVRFLDGQELRDYHMEIHMFVPTELLNLEFMGGNHRAPWNLV